MDVPYANGTIYHPNPRQSFPALPNIHPPFQQPLPSQANSHILPPLQPQRGPLDFSNDLFGQAARTSYSSIPPPYDDYLSQIRLRHSLPQATYQQPLQQYPNPSAYISQPSNTLLYDQSSQPPFPDLRPLTNDGISQAPALSAACDTTPIFPAQVPTHPTHKQDESPRTHVVGSQGRRGILPSAVGRPAAVTLEGKPPAKPPVVPIKDADGKFPCSHCNKTYLHAKHLKRHLLRHTGDRPYSCILCSDTFSRSDILKRHFQKCSIRRGNPTGATHLSNSQSHLKKQGARKLLVSDANNESGFLTVSPTVISTQLPSFESVNHPGLGVQSTSAGYQSASLPVSRSGSIKKASNGSLVRDRRSMTGPLPPAFKRASLSSIPKQADSASLPTTTVSTPLILRQNRHSGQFPTSAIADQFMTGPFSQDIMTNSTSSSYNRNSLPQLPGPPLQYGNALGWNPNLNNSKEGYSNLSLPELLASTRAPVKQESQEAKNAFQGLAESNNEELFCGLWGTPSNTLAPESYQTWSLHQTHMDSFHVKAQQLVSFCLADGPGSTVSGETENQLLRCCLTGQNIEHFLRHYYNFQVHWPLLHMATLNPVDAYDGLLLAMICIGAVYSDRVDMGQVRIMLDRSKRAIEQSSHIFNIIRGSPFEPDCLERRGSNGVEEIQALVMLQNLSIWHGDPSQRQSARDGFRHYVKLARQLRMLQPTPVGSSTYSPLHQLSTPYDHLSPGSWDWTSWVRQEKRSRLMYTIFLVDAALAMFFNCRPHFDPLEIKLPLPADDAAWDATNSDICACALGLHGTGAQEGNVAGSRRRTQPEMHRAMNALMHPTYDFEPRSTNAYSKFILVHGVHIQIWNIQQQLAQESNALYGLNDFGSWSNGTSTPVSQYDWVRGNNVSARTSTSNSGQATPTDSSGAQSPGTHQLLKQVNTALTKWKKMWDDDLVLQYPPDSKRLGFCRDGIHFYWLALMFLRKNRASDWQSASDSRFQQVINLLKQAKSYVATQDAIRGEESGSVADIDKDYGVKNLTLDMKQLFTPLTTDYQSPGPGMLSNINGKLM